MDNHFGMQSIQTLSKLACAIIIQASRDMQKNINLDTDSHHLLKQRQKNIRAKNETIKWIQRENDDEHLFSLENCCHFINKNLRYNNKGYISLTPQDVRHTLLNQPHKISILYQSLENDLLETEEDISSLENCCFSWLEDSYEVRI